MLGRLIKNRKKISGQNVKSYHSQAQPETSDRLYERTPDPPVPASAHCASPNNCYTGSDKDDYLNEKTVYKRAKKELTAEQHKGGGFAMQSYMKGIRQA